MEAFYGAAYRGFTADVRAEVRRETYDLDMGQHSWLDRDEWRAFGEWLCCGPGSTVLDVACGSGGPALELARRTGTAVAGVDVLEEAVAIARAVARNAGQQDVARFTRADASAPLPFADGAFDALVCVDAINHLPDRAAALADWRRLVRPGGMVVYTDPVIVSGVVSNEELAERSAIGFFTFAPPGEDERLIAAAGLELVRSEDATASVARIAGRWHAARARHADALVREEGADAFRHTQQFLATTAGLAEERRLTRRAFAARVPA